MQCQDGEQQAALGNSFPRTKLSARLFYGIIVSGLLFGMSASCLGGWLYLDGSGKPTGHSIWNESASQFVIPICAIIGATFGGLSGVGGAVAISTYRRRSTIELQKSRHL
jgi:hypothetical protein